MKLTIAKTVCCGWIPPNRNLQSLVVGGCVMVAACSVGAAYLPIVGPSPVRVQSRTPVARAELAITTATLANMRTAAEAQSTESSAFNPGDFVGPVAPPGIEFQAVSPAPRQESSSNAAGEPVISPQIVMQLFQDTNNSSGPTNQNSGVLVPVTFTPPVPPGHRAPSKAAVQSR